MFLFAICVHICFRPSENFESTFEISKKVRQNFIKKHLAFPSFLHLYENQEESRDSCPKLSELLQLRNSSLLSCRFETGSITNACEQIFTNLRKINSTPQFSSIQLLSSAPQFNSSKLRTERRVSMKSWMSLDEAG